MSSNGQPDKPVPNPRSTMLAVVFTLFIGGGLLVFLTFVTAGFFLWFIYITLIMGGFALVHYLLWGRMFERDTEAERKQIEAEEEVEQTMQPPWERRF
jgi:fatty acid desaturase